MISVNSAILESDIDTIDAKYLMCFVLNIELSDLPLKFDYNLSDAEYKKFTNLVKIRKTGTPIDIITGSKGFWASDFVVNENVLSPRPDSETIIESVLQHRTDKNKKYNILDLGTGSGCLLISLLLEYKNSIGIGVDISQKALSIAKTNADNNGLTNRIDFIQSDWFDNIPTQKFDIIISNPPYIPTYELKNLQEEVKKFDPVLALDGGNDGLDCYRNILKQMHNYIDKDSIIVVEFGYNQHQEINNLFLLNGYKLLSRQLDLSKIVRSHTYKKL